MTDTKRRPLVIALLVFVLYLVSIPGVLFIAAGTLDWTMAWVYALMLLSSALLSRFLVWRRNPDLLRERAEYREAENVEAWDRVLGPIAGLAGPFLAALVAGLDYRFGWTDRFSDTAQWLAAGIVLLGYAMGTWAMVVNRFFSAVVRIQEDRGQVVVRSGPYQIMRHPGYAGALLAMLAFPAMLNSTWSLIPALFMIVGLVIRTAREDRMLLEGLDGYQDYARETRYRLIPMIW